MRILLNGDPKDLPGPMSIAELLASLHIDPRIVAVEYDRVVIKRARYAETMVHEGGEVEIVNFVGGGASSPSYTHRPSGTLLGTERTRRPPPSGAA